MTTTTKPKRRSLRFSLRTMLIFMLVVCVAVGWRIERVRKQREAVAWVREMRGTVYYATDDNSFHKRTAEPRGPEWLRKWLGNDFFDDVVDVTLHNPQVNDVSPLAKLTELKWSDLSDTQVSEVSPLAKLTKLKWLSLANTRVSDVTSLAKLTNLETLLLHDTQVSDVSALAKLTKLEGLYLDNTQVSEVSPLAKLTKLEYLVLYDTQVSQEAIEQLKKALPQCEILY